MIKGRATIQLFDEKTGDVVREIHEENMITNAVDTILNPPDYIEIGIDSDNDRSFNMLRDFAGNIADTAFRGVIVCRDKIPEDGNNMMLPWTNEEIGHAGIANTNTDTSRLIYDNFLNGLSAETTENQLEEMGVKSYKGMHFSNSSIRQILSNITYTGNLLFQKEYVSDPITGKSKINRGEMPQYWVENTHEAIIPLETYRAVQEERQRRRELGVFANWSINTSCFTSKIKCGNCGASYRRSCKRQRKDKNEVYYVWVCQTYDRKGKASCPAKTVPECKLKAVCAEVLGLAEFDEAVFTERIRQITVIGDDILEFAFTDGTTLRKQWKSTAKTEWWTAERRKEWSERHKIKSTNPNRSRYNSFTGFIKCGNCGENYRSQGITYADGTKNRYWRCCKSCGNTGIKNTTMEALVCEVLGLSKHSEETMDTAIEKAVVKDGTVTFCFYDGHTESLSYKEKKKGTPHTEEYKQHMSRLTKSRWTPEARQEMSQRVKQLRKERGNTWRKEK